MGFDYSRKLMPIGQPDSMGCWYTCISWWTKAMALNSRRRAMEPLEVYQQCSCFVGDGWDAERGGLDQRALAAVGGQSNLRIKFDFITPSEFKSDMDIGSPTLVIYRYPQVGGTHMNVLFNQAGNQVTAMEPYYPLTADDGMRTGKYIRRPMTFFTGGSQVGIGYCPVDDSSGDN